MSGGKPAARLGDIGSKHGKCSPTPITSGSGDVTVNGKLAARVGDYLAPHCKHSRAIAAGSSSVTINGRPAARVDDAINCGGKVATGSGNVTIGDSPDLIAPIAVNLPDIGFAKQNGKVSKPSTLFHPETPVIQELEFKDVIVRIDIPAEDAKSDLFTLSATDGSYSATKTVKDDLIPGDNYIDLLFQQLDTSKLYTLEHTDPYFNETTTLFSSYSHQAINYLSSDKKEIATDIGDSLHKLLPPKED